MIILKSIFISGLQKYTLRIIFIEGLQVLCNYDHIEKHFDLGAPSFGSFLSRGSMFDGLFLKGTRIFFALWSSSLTLKIIFIEELQVFWHCNHDEKHFYLGAPSFGSFLSRGSMFYGLFLKGTPIFFALWSSAFTLEIIFMEELQLFCNCDHVY